MLNQMDLQPYLMHRKEGEKQKKKKIPYSRRTCSRLCYRSGALRNFVLRGRSTSKVLEMFWKGRNEILVIIIVLEGKANLTIEITNGMLLFGLTVTYKKTLLWNTKVAMY